MTKKIARGKGRAKFLQGPAPVAAPVPAPERSAHVVASRGDIEAALARIPAAMGSILDIVLDPSGDLGREYIVNDEGSRVLTALARLRGIQWSLMDGLGVYEKPDGMVASGKAVDHV